MVEITSLLDECIHLSSALLEKDSGSAHILLKEIDRILYSLHQRKTVAKHPHQIILDSRDDGHHRVHPPFMEQAESKQCHMVVYLAKALSGIVRDEPSSSYCPAPSSVWSQVETQPLTAVTYRSPKRTSIFFNVGTKPFSLVNVTSCLEALPHKVGEKTWLWLGR